MWTWRFPLLASMLPTQPWVVRVPLPLAIGTPPQQKLKSPVEALTSTTLPGLLSSWRQKLNALTVKLQLALLPEASVAVQVTVVAPTGKVDPEGGTKTTVTPGHLSDAVTVKLPDAPVAIGHEAAAVPVTLPGQVITGSCVSLTVTVKVHVSGPTLLLDLHVTVVVPTGKNEPEAGEQTTVPHVPTVVGAL